MTGKVGDPSEELKRLLSRIEEIGEQKRALPDAPGLDQFKVGERTRPPAGPGDVPLMVQPDAALQPRGKHTELELPNKAGKGRLARGVAIVIMVGVGAAAIYAFKMPAISIVVMRDGAGDATSTTVPSAPRDPREGEPASQLRRSTEPNQIDAEPAAVTPRTAAVNATNAEPTKRSRPLLIGALLQTSLQPDQTWPLGLRITPEAAGGTLVVKGLAAGAKLSVGRPSDTNGWELKADELDGAVIIPPAGFAGSMDLSVELRLGEGRVAERRSVQLEWARPPEPKPATAQTGGVDAPGFVVRKLDPDEIASPRKRGEELFANRDVAGARLMLLRAAEAADARAALALATTYDPIALGDMGSRGAIADPAMARKWYEKASLDFHGPELA